jgi:hypothetical protein
VVDDFAWGVVEDDRDEPGEGDGEKKDSSGGMRARAAIEMKEGVSGEKFKDGWADEELNHRDGREADVKLEHDDGDAPESEEPGDDAFRQEKEQSNGEVEVELEAEGPALKERHGEIRWDEEIGRQNMEGALVGATYRGREIVRKEREGVVDPKDGEDAGEAVTEEDG